MIRSVSEDDNHSTHRTSIPFSGCLRETPDSNDTKPQEGLASFVQGGRYGTWIFVDGMSCEVRYGPWDVAKRHHAISWSLDPMNDHLLMDDWEGMIAVREQDEVWALYFDIEGQ